MAGEGKSYLILSSGAASGNEMHRLRTLGMLEVLQEVHGVTLPRGCGGLAVVSEPTAVEADGLCVMICPGYLEREENRVTASEIIAAGEYNTVLSAVPVSALMDALSGVDVECGLVDCFSEDNYFGFKKGKISYVAGENQSEIGPGFAAIYNAYNYEDLYSVIKSLTPEANFEVYRALVESYSYEDCLAGRSG